MTPMFSIFTLAIKFDCLFLTIYQSFHLFFGFIFDKLAPPLNMYFKRCFKSIFSPLQCIKHSQSAKNVVFFPFCILVDMSMGGGYSPPPPLTTLLAKNVVFSLFCILVGNLLALPPLINVLNYASNHF